MKREPCAGWRGVRDRVLLGRGALGSRGEVAVGYGGKVLGAPWNGIQCGRKGVVLGGVECAALRVVCTELRGIMRTCCGQQHGCWCWCEWRGSHRGCGFCRVVTAGIVGARWVVLGGHRLSWAAEARAASGTWVITAH
jgi:hypothetical protein